MQIPARIKAPLRSQLRKCYNFITPLVNSPLPFPDGRLYAGTYSQNLEDLLIDALLGCQKSGTYIDIGANDPTALNNTKRFYDRGWSGINIEPICNKYEMLKESRKRDINLNVAISDTEGSVPFYVLGKETSSTLSFENAKRDCKEYHTKIVEIKQVRTCRLDTIIRKYLGTRHIDFISIDAEGHEVQILNSNDWEVNRPTLLVIEMWWDYAPGIIRFLEERNYVPLFQTAENGFFVDGGI